MCLHGVVINLLRTLLYLHTDEMLFTATAALVSPTTGVQSRVVILNGENRDWIWSTLAFHAFCYTDLTILVNTTVSWSEHTSYSHCAHENITETISCLQRIFNLNRHSLYGNKAILRYGTACSYNDITVNSPGVMSRGDASLAIRGHGMAGLMTRPTG
jgi:hypothetical protein